MPITIRNRLVQDPHRVVGLSAHRVNKRKQRRTDFHLALERRGVNLTQLASRTGLSMSYISRIVSGVRTPSLLTTIELARALGLGIVEMAGMLLPDEPIPVRAEVGHGASVLEVAHER